MTKTPELQRRHDDVAMPERRRLLMAGAGVVATSMLASASAIGQSQADTTAPGSPPGKGHQASATLGRRRLGSLEVSSVGLGVQNMSRTYQTTIPTRTEMHRIIRTAFERGVTFFDAAEAMDRTKWSGSWARAWRRSATRS